MADVPVRLHPRAEQEALAAWRWYNDRNRSAAHAFLAELDRTILLIAQGPLRWPRIHGRYRRFPMQKYPFSIVYAARRDFVEVIAIAHHRRRPGYWQHR